MDAMKEQFLEFAKEHFIALLVALAGLIFLIYGFVSFYYVSVPPDESSFASSTEPSTSFRQDPNSKPTKKSITVDVSGAVKEPGVYMLPVESRVQDAIVKAGGLATNVDQQRVAQTLNLAAPLTDGAKLYVPVVGEQMVTSNGSSGNSSGSVQGASTAMININAASADELDSLPGIGEVTANKIIENRPYTKVEELVDKKAVGQATFEKIKDQVTVY